MIKKILFVGLQYSYGKKTLGESLNKRAHFDTLKALGYQVENLWLDSFDSNEDLQKEILIKSKNYDPDMIFFKIFKFEIQFRTLIELRKKYFLINWFGDDHWRFKGFTSKYANFFDVCITTDKYSVEKYQEIGQKNIIRSQHASFESSTCYQNVTYKRDVSFVGGENSFRKWFVNKLNKKGVKVHCFGKGWSNGRVTYEEMEGIFVTSKINLNISNSVNYDMRYLISSPRAILNTMKTAVAGEGKNSSQIKARNFEIPTQGGFELTEYVPSLEDYFNIGKNIACYNSVDEAALLIKYYLNNNVEREKIKIKSVEYSRKNHLYKNRMAEIMQGVEIFYRDAKK